MCHHSTLPADLQIARPGPGSNRDETGTGEPRMAVSLLFHLGEPTATPEAIAAAHAAGVQVIDAVRCHLGGDLGDVDDACENANNSAVATEGCLRSVYRLPSTSDADRLHTSATMASQHQTRP
jgi:hypothetical protein